MDYVSIPACEALQRPQCVFYNHEAITKLGNSKLVSDFE